MRVLQLTAHFRPNIGGVETHLSDLCKVLAEKDFKVTVLTYQPLQTKAKWKIFEKEKNTEIIRLPWVPDLFYSLVNAPILEFLYLLPGIFLVMPFILLIKNVQVIHAHGVVAGFVGVFWGKIFGKKVIISLHSIYHFPRKGLYRDFVKWIFNNADYCLGLSKQSVEEIKSLGIKEKKVGNFTYWIDLRKFQKIADAKEKLNWKRRFTVLVVSRLVEGKGIEMILTAAEAWSRSINLVIAGHGPLEGVVRSAIEESKNIRYIGSIDQDKLPLYYSGSDILVVPSVSEEGFGRVILEALACGTPVIGANRGGIPEAIDNTVGKLIHITPKEIKGAVEYFYTHKSELKKLAQNCREFAERRYSEANVQTIINTYKS